MTSRSANPSLFDVLPRDVREALIEARVMVEVWFGGSDPDDIAARLDQKLDALEVPK